MTTQCPRCHFENSADTKFCGNCAAPLRLPGDISFSQAETLRSPIIKISTGTTLAGRYQVVEELGKGGMGQVYKVYDREIEGKVALKLLNPEIASDEETIKRFRNELKLARTVSHKNVCRMYDLGQHEGTYFITMEYVPGENLKSFIRRSGQLTVSKAAAIASQICAGLAEAHRLGVVHRDLKPQNIMIDNEGNARIMDFGIARSLKDKGVTGPGVVVGTPEYMSPEQVEGEDAGPRSDLYSLGVILFEMLTGRLPFRGETPFSIALKHKAEAPPDPREFNFRIPEELSRLILRCLEKDKDKRFPRADDVLSELTVIENRLPATEMTSAVRERAQTVTRKLSPRMLAPALVLGTLVIAAAVFFLLRGPRPAGKSGPETAPSSLWKNSIAVLPFRDYSPQKNQEGICDAMAESIIVRLSQFRDLKVTGTNSVMHYKNTDKDVQQIGNELGVTNVLYGTVRREGNKIRVMAELIDRDTKSVIWSKTVDRELQGIFDLQDQISQQIAEALKVKLFPAAAAASAENRPANVQAYEYYVKGMSFIKSKYVLFFREEDFKTGVEMFNKAIELDPNYALAYYGLCWAYEYRYQIANDVRDAEMMRTSGETAWRLDPSSALTNAALGYALYEYKGERDKAFELCNKALEINPNLGDVNFLVGLCYLYYGLYDAGIQYLTKAMELDPYNFWTPYKLAMCYMYSGDFEKADFYFKKYFELAPVEPLVFPGRNIALQIMMKRYDHADELVRRGEQATPDAAWVKKYRALLWAVKGEKDKALALWKDSDVYSLLGMKDESFQELNLEIRKTVSNPHIFYQNLIHNPFYDSLRGDPRFQKLVEREKKLYDEAASRYGERLSAPATP
jgi:serine/threonine protein kinase/tetratricopeptide (TPR) repeat protein